MSTTPARVATTIKNASKFRKSTTINASDATASVKYASHSPEPTAIRIDAKHTTKPTPSKPAFLAHTYHLNPTPLNNPSVYPITFHHLLRPSHPLHIRTRRRFSDYDSETLHWNVHVPLDVSKNATVRDWVKRRVREAFAAELKERGWDREGKVVGGDEMGKAGLKGALRLQVLAREKVKVLKASGEEVRGECGRVIERVITDMQKKRRAAKVMGRVTREDEVRSFNERREMREGKWDRACARPQGPDVLRRVDTCR